MIAKPHALLHRDSNPFGEAFRIEALNIGHQDGKHTLGEPADPVGFAEIIPDHNPDALDHPVSGPAAMLVIDLVEVVDVNHDDCERVAEALSALNLFFERGDEHRLGVQRRQRIDDRVVMACDVVGGGGAHIKGSGVNQLRQRRPWFGLDPERVVLRELVERRPLHQIHESEQQAHRDVVIGREPPKVGNNRIAGIELAIPHRGRQELKRQVADRAAVVGIDVLDARERIAPDGIADDRGRTAQENAGHVRAQFDGLLHTSDIGPNHWGHYCTYKNSTPYRKLKNRPKRCRGCVDGPLGEHVRTMIGECLRQAGIITEEALQAALIEHKRSGERLGSVLIRLNLATERQIAEALAYQLGFAYADLVAHPPDPAAVMLIPKDVAIKRNCVAIAVEKNVLTVAMSDPLLFTLVQDLEFQTGYRIKQVVATRGEIIDAIQAWYQDMALTRVSGGLRQAGVRDSAGLQNRRRDEETRRGGMATPRTLGGVRDDDIFEQTTSVGGTAETAPIIDMVDLVIKNALKSHASDIHIEPTDADVVVRHRLDGLLKEVMDLPKWVHDGLVARVKIMAGLDIAEKRLPQDGRIRTTVEDGQEVDLRVSTLRTIFGEKIVLRVLDHRKGVPPLEELGFSSASMEHLRFFLRHQHGMILVVGPTGSGKTTTLSSALASIRSERTNIITIEDPVEYQIPGVNQTQINSKINLTFASSLRSILRQDPDVVLVGEIRDQETARIAMQAAQTGHLVLSTLHTDDAPSCVTRLTDIGVEPYVAASALVGVIAQRLVRRLCSDCRRPYTPEPETLRAMGVSEAEAGAQTFYRADGCEKCNHTGYRGRVGIYEIMPVTDSLRRLIAQRGAEARIREAAIAAGMITLGEDGLLKVKAGMTSPQELLRVVTEVRQTRMLCPGCNAAVSPDFSACPSCGYALGGGCPHCRRPIQPEWKFCPFCAKSTSARGGERQARRLAARRSIPELPAPRNIAEFKK